MSIIEIEAALSAFESANGSVCEAQGATDSVTSGCGGCCDGYKCTFA